MSQYVDWEPIHSFRTYSIWGRGNAEKVILGAKTPHPWCTTFKGFTENRASVAHPHSTTGRDKMDIWDQKVISRSSDPTNQSLRQQQRTFQLLFYCSKDTVSIILRVVNFNPVLISLQGMWNVGRGNGPVVFSSFQISNRYIKKTHKNICANLKTFTTFHSRNI